MGEVYFNEENTSNKKLILKQYEEDFRLEPLDSNWNKYMLFFWDSLKRIIEMAIGNKVLLKL